MIYSNFLKQLALRLHPLHLLTVLKLVFKKLIQTDLKINFFVKNVFLSTKFPKISDIYL